MNKIINVILILLLLIPLSEQLYGQNYKKELASAEAAFHEGRYKDACDFYENAVRMIEKPSKEHLEVFYMQGYCEMRSGDYRKAMNTYARYLNLAKRYGVNIKELAQVREWNDWCAIELTEYPERKAPGYNDNITITNLKTLNSAHNDYGAMLIENNTLFLFTSNRQTGDEKILSDINDNIYIAQYKKNDIGEPLKVIARFNTKYEDISSSYCTETKTLYLAYSEDYNTSADIYFSKKINDHWSDPEKVPGLVNTKGFEGYPSISKDGKVLYFSSDRAGTIGNKDIFFSVLQENGLWGEPKNLGYGINTKFDEITPHIDSTGSKIYFSSNGHLGLGGFDIYYSEFEASNLWGEATNLPQPVNSESDEIFYVTTSVSGVAFFSSKRKGGTGIYDIYRIDPKSVKEVKPKEEPIIAKVDTEPVVKEKKEEPIVPVTEPKKVEPEVKPVVIEKPVVVEKKVEKPVVTEPVKPVTKPVTPKETKPEPSKQAVVTPPKSSPPKIEASREDIQLYSAEVNGLEFKVQLGAFKNHITVNSPFFTSKIDPKNLNEEQAPPDMLYKYTIGQYRNIKSASEYKMQMRSLGYSDAFLTCYFNNNRIQMDEAKNIIKQDLEKGKVSVIK